MQGSVKLAKRQIITGQTYLSGEDYLSLLVSTWEVKDICVEVLLQYLMHSYKLWAELRPSVLQTTRNLTAVKLPNLRNFSA